MRHVRALVSFSVALFVATAALAEEKTFAERLGWNKGDRLLIMHIDDAGMSHDSNLGTIDAIERGVANSVSVMMPCPWVPEIVRWIKANPGVDAGLHLTLTSEWNHYRWGPLMGKPAVPGLVDEEGCLWGGVAEVVANATADEVEAEIRAQLDRARTMGFEPTHFDSHMGTLFATPEFLERYIRVGIEEQIPVMLPGGHNTLLKEQYRQGALAEARRINERSAPDAQIDPEEHARKAIEQRFGGIESIAEMVWQAGLPVLDDLHNTSYGWRFEDKVQNYVDAVRSLKPGVTMMINHCTRPTEVFEQISTSGPTRYGDLIAMLDPRVRKAIEEEGVILTTFKELKERRDALK